MAEPKASGVARASVEVPVDWEALEDAFENNAPEVHSYLHLASGEVLRVVDGIADPQMHSRIAADKAYLCVEPVSSREQYRWMERFILMLDEGVLRDELTLAIDGRGAFRRFKDVLMVNPPERERWFAFRSERLRVFMEAWLAAHALEVVPRPEPQPLVAAELSEPAGSLPTEGLPARRSRNAEVLRRQLRELSMVLGARDLDRILTFAEFVKARGVARGHAHGETSIGESTESRGAAGEPNGGEESCPSAARE